MEVATPLEKRKNKRITWGGMLMVFLGALWLAYQYQLTWDWESTTATVVSVKSLTSSNVEGGSSTTYQPTLRFSDSAGLSHTVTTGYSSSQFNFATNERVSIIYDPKAPRYFRIHTFVSFWLMPLLAIGFGSLIIFLSKSI